MLQKKIRVTTASGKVVLKSKCCTINNEYYIKDEEAVKVGITWFVKDDPRIFFDNDSQTWMRTRGVRVMQGVIGKNPNGSLIMGAFAFNPSKNITVYILDDFGNIDKDVTYMNKDLMTSNSIRFNKASGLWEDTTALNVVSQKVENVLSEAIGIGSYNYLLPQEYSSSKHLDKFMEYDRDMSINNPINFEDVEEFGDFSFGLEFETSAGKLGLQECFDLGLIPLRDGSIPGIEYSTIPMQGAEGFNLLINQIKTLQKRAEFDKDCSLHLHLGGFPVDKDYIWALYKLLIIIEPQIARILPKYAFNTSRFKTKGKDYCNKLYRVSSFSDYYTYCTEGTQSYKGSLILPHPLDSEDRAKWNIHARYAWANLINMMFKDTGKTVEFRVHAPSFNIQKIINWMFVCAAILKYARKNKDKLLAAPISSSGITLEDLIRNVYSDRVFYQLRDYIHFREIYFNNLAWKYNDCAGLTDLRLDKTITFGTDLITPITH